MIPLNPWSPLSPWSPPSPLSYLIPLLGPLDARFIALMRSMPSTARILNALVLAGAVIGAPSHPEGIPEPLVPDAIVKQDREDPRPKKRGGDSSGIPAQAVGHAPEDLQPPTEPDLFDWTDPATEPLPDWIIAYLKKAGILQDRNKPCPCGGGCKYKRCHLDAVRAASKRSKWKIAGPGEREGHGAASTHGGSFKHSSVAKAARKHKTDFKRMAELRHVYITIEDALMEKSIHAKMMKCGVRQKVCVGCKKYHFAAAKCGSRLCPFEARRLSGERVAIYGGMLKKMKHPRFLTFTQPLIPYQESLSDGVKLLRKAFGRIRRSLCFKSVKGGVYSIEIVLRPGGFHIHLHTLLDAVWVENRKGMANSLESTWHRTLRKMGCAVEGKRVVVDIRRADKKSLKEVLKYSVKGAVGKKKDEGNDAGRRSRHSLFNTGGKSDISGRKKRIPQAKFSEVPEVGLRQLVDLLEGRVHLIEPFGCFRGAIGEFRERERAEARDRADEQAVCTACGGFLIDAGIVRWRDVRFRGSGDSMTVIPPPDESDVSFGSTAAWA